MKLWATRHSDLKISETPNKYYHKKEQRIMYYELAESS